PGTGVPSDSAGLQDDTFLDGNATDRRGSL
ncbi:MAG: hypothetical protein JWM61_927, partial [Micrococcaceae bacterium]|nr:hypothetical protein [Micrococcaceae bacterium]